MGIIFTLISINAIAFLIWDNSRRAKKTLILNLRPNCLLSPYPFVFLGGKKSIFYFLAYWGDLPRYLAEHGYEVFHLNFPWSANKDHLVLMENLLQHQEDLARDYHLVIDASHENALEQTLRQRHYPYLRSCLLIDQKNSSLARKLSQRSLKPLQNILNRVDLVEPTRSWVWRLHQLWTRQSPSLDLRTSLEFKHQNKTNFELILNQFIAISERDFYTDDHTTGETTYDESSDRPAGDFPRPAELS